MEIDIWQENKRRKMGAPDPDDPTAQYESVEWAHYRSAAAHYAQLRVENRTMADRFLARLIKPAEHLTVPLRDTSGIFLNASESVSAIPSDTEQRATRAAQRGPAKAEETARFVSGVRKYGALRHPAMGAVLSGQETPF